MTRTVIQGNPDWQRVLRHFELIDPPEHQIPGYIVLVVPDARTATSCRENLAAFLRGRGADLYIASMNSPETLGQIAITLRHLSITPETGAVWLECVVGEWEDRFAEWRDAWQHAAVGLNRSRDTLLQNIPAPIVLVGAPWLMETLKSCAPDLWSARSLVANVAVPSTKPLLSIESGSVQEGLTVGDPEFALRQAEKYRGVEGRESILAMLLTRAATLYLARGDGTNAGRLSKEAKKLFAALLPHQSENPEAFGATLNELAILNYRLGFLDDAMLLLQRYEAASADRGDRAALARSYGNQSLVLRKWRRLDEAMTALKKQEAICTEIEDREGLQACYGNQALVLKEQGLVVDALALLQKQESLAAKLGDRASVARSYGNKALVLKALGRLEEAMALLKKQENICSELGEKGDLARSYGNQALILQAWGDLDGALLLIKRQEEICGALSDRACVAISHANQGQVLQQMNRQDEAEAHLRRAASLFAELGMEHERGMAQSLIANSTVV